MLINFFWYLCNYLLLFNPRLLRVVKFEALVRVCLSVCLCVCLYVAAYVTPKLTLTDFNYFFLAVGIYIF